jgi:hypothetical protein
MMPPPQLKGTFGIFDAFVKTRGVWKGTFRVELPP